MVVFVGPNWTLLPLPDGQQATQYLVLLSSMDLALLELEKRLFRYAKVGPELLEMADEGLVLAARAKARLGQALSAAQHAEGHLQVVGVGIGDWKPTGTRPAWNAEPPAYRGGLLSFRIGSHRFSGPSPVVGLLNHLEFHGCH